MTIIPQLRVESRSCGFQPAGLRPPQLPASNLQSMEEMNLDALAEFVAIGARLLYMKSRALLPQEPGAEGAAAEEDEAEDLGQLLIEYRRYREVAATLRQREEQGLR